MQQLQERRWQQTPPTQITLIEPINYIVSWWDDGKCVNPGIKYSVFEQDMIHFYIFKDNILECVRMDRIGQADVIYT